MIGLYVSIGRQRSKRFEIAKERVTIGSDASNDLVLRDGGVAPFHGALVRVRERWFLSPRETDPGTANRMRALEDGARIPIGEYTVVLAVAPVEPLRVRPAATPVEPLPVPAPAQDLEELLSETRPHHRLVPPVELAPVRDPIEQSLIDAIIRGDEDSRLVYADWLEGRGDAVRAEFLRLSRALAGMDPTDPAQRDQLKERTRRLRELAPQVDFAWRREIARPVVEGCDRIRTDFQCKMDWGSLAPTDRPGVRHCHGCGDDVHYAPTLHAARDLVRRGRCVAIDPGEARRPNDLDAPLVMHMSPRAAPVWGPPDPGDPDPRAIPGIPVSPRLPAA